MKTSGRTARTTLQNSPADGPEKWSIGERARKRNANSTIEANFRPPRLAAKTPRRNSL